MQEVLRRCGVVSCLDDSLESSGACIVYQFHSLTLISSSLFSISITSDKKLQQNLADASRAVILECDQEECVQVECVKGSNGEWQCEVGLEFKTNSAGPVSQRVVMMDIDDTE